jgi:hypothetical protein
MGRVRSTHGVEESCIHDFRGLTEEEKIDLEDLEIDERVMG